MRIARLPLALLAAATTLAHAPGQSLRERAVAATQLYGKGARTAVQQLGLNNTPPTDLAALFQDESPLLEAKPWHLLGIQVRERRHDLMKLWHKDAAVRANNAQLFAKLPFDWVRQHAVVGAKKRLDIEAIAGHQQGVELLF